MHLFYVGCHFSICTVLYGQPKEVFNKKPKHVARIVKQKNIYQ